MPDSRVVDVPETARTSGVLLLSGRLYVPDLLENLDMNAPQRALAAAAITAALLAGLAACGGSDSGDSASSSNSAAAGQAADGSAQAEGEESGDPVETPLTGEVKQKAEAAAVAAFPGTVVKSEEDAENPGMYAVEIKKADGSEVEVYLDPKTYKVVKTKDEAGDDD
ncbi:PepSY domain-containing protein [Streptomyces sp. NPDC046859]|uniref:PepSY domain-containing protein n=1 Tax=Streptomyces sp. NPDC046859 TaxID=3155734 RepID=UPI0033E6ACEC